MSIIFVHELGHLIAAKYYKWNTDKIYIYPLGGVTKFNECINKPLKEELVITIMGPLFQIVYYYILTFLGVKNIVTFNFLLLFFNLLPIYPLDGGKLLNIALSSFFPYKLSYKITIYISYLFYFLEFFFFVFFSNSYFFILISFLLLFKIIEEDSKRNYYFNKFLLERYLGNYHFKYVKYISSISSMQKNRNHIFKYRDNIITEKQMLKNIFNSTKLIS